MFDAHAHLTEIPPVGPVAGWIIPGVSLASEARSFELARDPRIHSALGLHPWHLPGNRAALESLIERLRELVCSRPVVAIGETGLDKGRRGGPMELQRLAFRAQIRIAKTQGLPLIIHCVRAHGGCLDILSEEGFEDGGMVHDFTGPPEMIEPWARAGFALSISPRGLKKTQVLRMIPDERLLIETDDRPTTELPAVCAAVAHARGEDPQFIARLTESNLRRLLQLGPPDSPEEGLTL